MPSAHPRIRAVLRSAVLRLVWVADGLSQAVLFFLMLLSVADVFLRKTLNSAILGTAGITEGAMVVMIFFSLARCAADDGHIRIDLILGRVGPRTAGVIDLLTSALLTVFSGVLTWAVYGYAVTLRQWGEVTLDLGMPLYPFAYLACGGCGLMTLVFFIKFIARSGEFFRG